MDTSVTKFINYTREAFLLPFHLFVLATATIGTLVLMALLPAMFGMNPTFLIFLLGGLEMLYLGLIPRMPGFRKAVHRKYAKQLQSWQRQKEITGFYNALSARAQRRYEAFSGLLKKARQNYNGLNDNFGGLVRDYMLSIDRLRTAYLKLLYAHDRNAYFKVKANPTNLRQQIEEIRQSMQDDTERIREIKSRRIKLLEDRLKNQKSASENRVVLEEQLKAMEETIRLFAEYAGNDWQEAEESQLANRILSETEELHETLSEVDQVFREELIEEGTESDFEQQPPIISQPPVQPSSKPQNPFIKKKIRSSGNKKGPDKHTGSGSKQFQDIPIE